MSKRGFESIMGSAEKSRQLAQFYQKRGMESINDSTEKSRQMAQSYQLRWKDHWMPASSKSTTERCGDSARKDKELDWVSTDGEKLRSSKGFEEDTDETRVGEGTLNHFIGQGTSKSPLKWMKTGMSAKEASSTTSMPFFGSSTQVVSYSGHEKNKIDKGKGVMFPSLLSRPSVITNNELQKSQIGIVEQEHCQNKVWSGDLIRERASDSPRDACFGEHNRSLLLDTLSVEDLAYMYQDWVMKLPNYSNIPLHPIQKNESKISNHDNHSLQKLTNCDHNMETMRIFPAMDSVETTTISRLGFCQKTKSLLIIPNDVIRSPCDVHNLEPFFGHANGGVKLQSLSSSSNSERQRNVKDIGAATSKAAKKNDSSTETDTMIMNNLKVDRPTSVANSTGSTKGFSFGTNLSPRFDINLEPPPDSPAVDPSSSRTQSLELDLLLPPADPTTRWVKRLKVTTSDSCGRGTKISTLPEYNSSCNKNSAFFKNVLKNSISRSASLLKNEEQRTEMLLSHPWIKRFMRNGSQMSQKKPEATAVCEPQSSKMDDAQKKQSPSIAAMAIMGKAMSGYPQCEFEKRGNFTVWNTKTS